MHFVISSEFYCFCLQQLTKENILSSFFVTRFIMLKTEVTKRAAGAAKLHYNSQSVSYHFSSNKSHCQEQ